MKPKPNKGVKCVPGLAALHRTAKPPLRSGLSAAYPGVILQNSGILEYVEFRLAVVLPIIFGWVYRTKYPTLGGLVYARSFLRQ